MSNLFSTDLSFSQDPEMLAHMPESFQTMIRIQQAAEAEYESILKDIESGKITLEEVLHMRGIKNV